MENIEHDELQALKQRVDFLEQQMKNLGKLLLQMGQQLSETVEKEAVNETITTSKTFVEEKSVGRQHSALECGFKNFTEQKAVPEVKHTELATTAVPAQVQEEVAVKDFPTLEVRQQEAIDKEIVVEDEMARNIREFIASYDSGNTEFEAWDVPKEIVKDLTKYLEWKQVPEYVKKTIRLGDTYEVISYYASSYDYEGEYIYLVAPADRDSKYTQRQLIRLGLPAFYDITYGTDLGGKSLKLIKPAVFLQEIKNGEMIYVLKEKGKIILAR